MKKLFKQHHYTHNNERGFILILVIGVSLVLSAIAVSILSIETTKYAKTTGDVNTTSAVYVAEAGISDTLSQLNLNTGFTGYTTKKQFYSSTDQGKAEYTTTVTDNGNNTLTLSSTGYLSRRASDTTPYMTKTLKVLVFANKKPITDNIVAGSAGLIVSGQYSPWSSSTSSANGSIYSRGKIALNGSTSAIGTFANPAKVTAANVGCGTSTNWPQACASNDPPITLGGGSFGSGNGTIYGSVCATNQPASSNILPGSTGSGLQSACIAPDYGMPSFDKTTFTSNATVATPTSGCSFSGSTLTWPDKARINGSVNIGNTFGSCTITVAGDVYIKGSLTLGANTSLRVADSLGARQPRIVVNGSVSISGVTFGTSPSVVANSAGTPLTIISFASSDNGSSSCSNSDTTCTLSSADQYNTTAAMRSANWYSATSPGISIQGGGTFGGSPDVSGLVAYSYFGVTSYTVSGNQSMRGIGGQGVIINPGAGSFWNNSGNLTVSDASPFTSIVNRTTYAIGDYLPVYN